MKQIVWILLGILLASNTSVALASTGQIYGSLNAGYSMIPGKVTGYSTLPATAGIAIQSDAATPNYGKLKSKNNALNLAAEVGCYITDEVRTGLSFVYLMDSSSTLNKDSYTAPQISASPKLQRNSWGALASFYYDLLSSSELIPYIGLKVGYGSTTYKVDSVQPYDVNTGLPVGVNGAFQSQIILQTGDQTKKTAKGVIYGGTLGASYQMSDNLIVDANYTALKLAKAETKISTYPALASPTVPAAGDVVVKYKGPSLSHTISIGGRFLF